MGFCQPKVHAFLIASFAAGFRAVRVW